MHEHLAASQAAKGAPNDLQPPPSRGPSFFTPSSTAKAYIWHASRVRQLFVVAALLSWQNTAVTKTGSCGNGHDPLAPLPDVYSQYGIVGLCHSVVSGAAL